jgi:coproporphyrinogen III oxidase
MNTRMVITSKGWFGGGGDLTLWLMRRRTQDDKDSKDFHAAMRAACQGQKSADYPRFKAWCDEYFYLPHRKECARHRRHLLRTISTAETGSRLRFHPKRRPCLPRHLS